MVLLVGRRNISRLTNKKGRNRMSEKEHSAEFLMIKLLHVYATKTFHQLSHVNLHPGQMPMLNILYQQEGISQREICNSLCIKPSTVTVSLQRMEKADLIYRVADAKDKRIQRIYLTDHGKEIHLEVEKIRKEVGNVMLQGMTPEEVDHLKKQILQMQENLEKMPGSTEMKDYL